MFWHTPPSFSTTSTNHFLLQVVYSVQDILLLCVYRCWCSTWHLLHMVYSTQTLLLVCVDILVCWHLFHMDMVYSTQILLLVCVGWSGVVALTTGGAFILPLWTVWGLSTQFTNRDTLLGLWTLPFLGTTLLPIWNQEHRFQNHKIPDYISFCFTVLFILKWTRNHTHSHNIQNSEIQWKRYITMVTQKVL